MNQVRTHTLVSKKNLLTDILHIIVRYGKTQLLLAILITIVSWILLSLLGIRFTFFLAVLSGALGVVPVIGMAIASLIVGLVAIVDGARFLPNVSVVFEGLVLFVLYGLLNFVIDYFLSPYLTGKISNIHPIILIFGVIIGTTLFGLPGAILSTPILLVSKTILDYYRHDSSYKRNT